MRDHVVAPVGRDDAHVERRRTARLGVHPLRDRGAHFVEREGETIEDERAQTLCESRGDRDRESRHAEMLPFGGLQAEGLAEALAEAGKLGVGS